MTPKDWYDKHFSGKNAPTQEFEDWWQEFYGPRSDYEDTEDEAEEYWKRKAFAWHGWRNARAAMIVTPPEE